MGAGSARTYPDRLGLDPFLVMGGGDLPLEEREGGTGRGALPCLEEEEAHLPLCGRDTCPRLTHSFPILTHCQRGRRLREHAYVYERGGCGRRKRQEACLQPHSLPSLEGKGKAAHCLLGPGKQVGLPTRGGSLTHTVPLTPPSLLLLFYWFGAGGRGWPREAGRGAALDPAPCSL